MMANRLSFPARGSVLHTPIEASHHWPSLSCSSSFCYFRMHLWLFLKWALPWSCKHCRESTDAHLCPPAKEFQIHCGRKARTLTLPAIALQFHSTYGSSFSSQEVPLQLQCMQELILPDDKKQNDWNAANMDTVELLLRVVLEPSGATTLSAVGRWICCTIQTMVGWITHPLPFPCSFSTRLPPWISMPH